jgi:hypothetical protein
MARAVGGDRFSLTIGESMALMTLCRFFDAGEEMDPVAALVEWGISQDGVKLSLYPARQPETWEAPVRGLVEKGLLEPTGQGRARLTERGVGSFEAMMGPSLANARRSFVAARARREARNGGSQ